MKVPTITRISLTALLVKDDRDCLVLTDTGLRVVSADAALDAGGRLVCTRTDLLDAGVRVSASDRSRLAAGSGPIVDRLARELTDLMREAVEADSEEADR